MKSITFPYAVYVAGALVMAAFVFPGTAVATNQNSQLSSISAGKAAPTNANCQANCVKYFREGNELKIVSLDQNGKIFSVESVRLPQNAKLSTVSKGVSSGDVTARNVQTPPKYSPGTVWTAHNDQTYTSHRGGNTYVTTVSTTLTYHANADGTSTLINTQTSKDTVKIETDPK